MKQLFIDVESAGLDESQLLPIMPDFEPDKRLKDADKIIADLLAKRQSWLDGAALKPTTGKVIACSFACNDEDVQFFATENEQSLLFRIHDEIRTAIDQGGRVYGWNITGFDLPFLTGRCSVWNIPAFKSFTSCYRGRWSWNEAFIDPMQIWAGPGQRHDGASLNNVAYALGLGLKEGSGKDFAELLKTDPEAARKYSVNDVLLLRSVVSKMGI